MFHVLQAAARAEQRAIPAKGLTGPGYDGHTFWDTETFVLPVLTYTAPETVPDALRWRHSILDGARQRASDLGLNGAAFPWRTIHGEECSGYWPASTAAFHINADIADAVLRYMSATEDVAFERKFGVELLVETARLWASVGHHDRGGEFRIDGVTGPDEYSALADNNLYTNLMAQRNLKAAADAAERHKGIARRLKVTRAEIRAWRSAAKNIYIPYEPELGHVQLAHDYLGEAALMDINDLEHNVRDGVHMGSLAGAWLAAVHGLGGMRHHGESLGFRPRLPRAIRKLTFRVIFLGRLLKVSFDHRQATYSLVRGRPITFDHYGMAMRLSPGRSAVRGIPERKAPPQPKQPFGRAPARPGRQS